MGQIAFNNEVYGSNSAEDILYESGTVKEALDNSLFIDVEDTTVLVENTDNLTYGNIVDNLNSDSANKVLSAKQGKVLNNKINNLDLSYLEELIESQATALNNFQDTFLNLVYPVGAIYLSLNSTNPGSLFGGNWEALENRFLLGAGSDYAVNSTGGEATHTLTANEMPKHSHTQNAMVHGYSGWSSFNTGSGYSVVINQASGSNYHSPNSTLNAATVTMHVGTNSAGGGAAHNNMPPYLTVYMWKRVS